MVRIVDLQEVSAIAIDSSDYFVISHLNANVGTYGTARISAGQIYQFLNGPPPETNLTSTDDFPEGLNNLYYTDERARASISVSGSLSYNQSTGVISYTQPTNISTFTNNAGYLDSNGVRASISVSGSLSYNQSTGVISYTQPTNISTFTNNAGYLNSDGVTSLIDSTYVQGKVPEAYITGFIDSAYVQGKVPEAYITGFIDSAYVNERARTSISVSGSLSYNSFTGVISYTQPTNISTFTNNAGYLNSDGVTSLIDSAYVNERVSTIDSAQVLAIVDPLYVGIGGDSMTGNLWVDGEIYASGNITGYGSFSDLTLKENIIQIEDALEKVAQLTGYTFNYIGHSQRVAGLIAQEVELVHPEVVYQTSDNKKAIYYGNLVGLIVEAIKEIKSDLDAIKEKIK